MRARSRSIALLHFGIFHSNSTSGLSAVFGEVPQRETLTDEFIRHYYRYADQLFQIRQGEVAFTDIGHLEFEFEIYASGEYSRMLEREWAET